MYLLSVYLSPQLPLSLFNHLTSELQRMNCKLGWGFACFFYVECLYTTHSVFFDDSSAKVKMSQNELLKWQLKCILQWMRLVFLSSKSIFLLKMMEQVYEYSTENGLPCQNSGNLIVFLFQLRLYYDRHNYTLPRSLSKR